MFDKVLELLAALALAFSGAVGLSTAADNVGRGTETEPPASVDLADERAALEAARGLAGAAEARSQSEELAAEDAALDALARAMANAPDEADSGLATALQAVTNRGAPADPGNASDAAVAAPAFAAPPVTAPPVTGVPATTPPVPAPPVDTPAGPPADLPGGRP